MPSNVDYENSMLDMSAAAGAPLEFNFQEKQVLEIQDSQLGNYSGGELLYSLETLATTKGFVDWKAGHIVLPAQITLSSATAAKISAEHLNMYAVSIKNTVYQLIHSTILTCNGTTIVSAQQWSGIVQAYLLLSSWNNEDQMTKGPDYICSKDSVASLEYTAEVGEINNRIVAAATGSRIPGASTPINTGRLNRIDFQHVDIADALAANFVSQQSQTSLRRSTCNVAGTSSIVFNIQYVIPLDHLHDVFTKIPLCRGALWTLQVRTHLPCSASVTMADAAAENVWTAQTAVSIPNGIMPFMLTQGGTTAGSGLKSVAGNTGFTLSAVIGNSMQTVTQLRLPVYSMTPKAELAYLETPVRTIRYQHFLSTYIDQTAGSGWSERQITAGRSRVRRLIMFPTAKAAGAVLAAPASMVSSCPGTAAPYVGVSAFNVFLGGKALYQSDKRYGFQTWLDEVRGSGSLNGGFTDNLVSSLINRRDFESCYGVIDVDLSRHPLAEDDVAHAVTVSANIESVRDLRWYVYLFYEETVNIDCDSGQLVVA